MTDLIKALEAKAEKFETQAADAAGMLDELPNTVEPGFDLKRDRILLFIETVYAKSTTIRRAIDVIDEEG